jgi:hypothetical protein
VSTSRTAVISSEVVKWIRSLVRPPDETCNPSQHSRRGPWASSLPPPARRIAHRTRTSRRQRYPQQCSLPSGAACNMPCEPWPAIQAPRLTFPRALSPTTPEGPLAALACCFTCGLVWLHPSRRTGHLRIPIEAESGSLALRLTCSPPDSPVPSLGLALVRLHAEQATYTVNSFQFTRSARLILAYRPRGSGPDPELGFYRQRRSRRGPSLAHLDPSRREESLDS